MNANNEIQLDWFETFFVCTMNRGIDFFLDKIINFTFMLSIFVLCCIFISYVLLSQDLKQLHDMIFEKMYLVDLATN